MKTMRVQFVWWVLVLGLIVAFQPTSVRADNSPFKGTWEGPFKNNVTVKGTMTLTIADNGTFEGAWVLTEPYANVWEGGGKIDNEGNATGGLIKPVSSTLSGSVTKTDDGKIKGIWKQTFPTGDFYLEFLLSPKA